MKSTLSALFLIGVVASLPPLLRGHAAAQNDARGMQGQVTAQTERRVALVIGNGGYQDSPLLNPVNDARAMRQALRVLGFDVLYGENLSQNEMKRAVRGFGERIRNGGVGLFYYAGHGTQTRGNNYLIPVGAMITNEDDVEYESVDVGLVLAQMATAHNRLNIVILDACRNNPFARSFRSAQKGLASIDAPSGTLIAYATAPGSLASDGAGANGLYTQELLKVIMKPEMSIEQVFKQVRIAVQNLTQGKQVPWESSSLVGDFYFLPTAIEPGVKGNASSSVDTAALELTFWESIKNSTNPDDFKAYLRQYPNGRFAAVATIRASPPRDPIERIKQEGLNRSQVMEIASHLTKNIGPRLTGSPNMKKANEWTRDKLTAWGLQDAHLEAWGPFGRGWSIQSFSAEMTAPQRASLIAYPKAWSPGTNGELSGAPVYLDAETEADLQKYKGSLRGAIVLISPLREVSPIAQEVVRFNAEDLRRFENAPASTAQAPKTFSGTPEQKRAAEFSLKRLRFLNNEQAGLVIEPSRGSGDLVFVQSASIPIPEDRPANPRPLAWEKGLPQVVPQIVVAAESYNDLVRLIQQGKKIKLSVNLNARFYDEDPMAYNTIAEITGTDLKDEIVMLGAHLDSWHGGAGATDDAAGVAVVMEAVRIIQTLGLKPRRTIRVGLWSGQEQGLLGSRSYVAQHLGKRIQAQPSSSLQANQQMPPRFELKPEHEKFSAYFNLDNGTGKIRGIYLQGNEGVRSVFHQWLMAFMDQGASTLTIANTGGTDHLSFDAIGLPAFQFIQDPIDYVTRTHHSNQDVYERLEADDLKQAATIMAAFAYNAAVLDKKLPRKPLPTK